MIARLANVKDSVEVGRLSTCRKHGRHTTFQRSYFSSNSIVCWVLQASIKVATLLQVEKSGHLLAGIIFECCTLIDGQHTRLTFFRRPSRLNTQGFRIEFLTHNDLVSISNCNTFYFVWQMYPIFFYYPLSFRLDLLTMKICFYVARNIILRH